MNISVVEKININTYKFELSKDLAGPFIVKLLNKNSTIGTFNNHVFEITNLDCNERPFFEIETEDDVFILAERTLPVEGMNNFRDMGGYRTKNGKRVKWGKLFRSDHLWNATENGIDYLKNLRIETIVDYRSDDEIEKYPNAFIGERDTYVLDPNAHAAELSAQFSSSKKDEDQNLINKIKEQKEKGVLKSQYDIILKQYKNFVYNEDSKKVFASMLELASQENSEPILQHCRGGKDRTGFGALLILGTLGVPNEILVYDYMLTEKNRIERNRVKMEGYKELTQDKEILEYLYSLIDTRSDFIETSINEIDREFGNIENYVIKSLGISKQTVERLKNKYLD